MTCEHDWEELDEDHHDLGGHPRHPDATHACTKCGVDGRYVASWGCTGDIYTDAIEVMDV